MIRSLRHSWLLLLGVLAACGSPEISYLEQDQELATCDHQDTQLNRDVAAALDCAEDALCTACTQQVATQVSITSHPLGATEEHVEDLTLGDGEIWLFQGKATGHYTYRIARPEHMGTADVWRAVLKLKDDDSIQRYFLRSDLSSTNVTAFRSEHVTTAYCSEKEPLAVHDILNRFRETDAQGQALYEFTIDCAGSDDSGTIFLTLPADMKSLEFTW